MKPGQMSAAICGFHKPVINLIFLIVTVSTPLFIFFSTNVAP
jgi:hypothetical protein